MKKLLGVLSLLGLGFGLALALAQPASALPMYAQRSGRTCGNCHMSPTWEDQGGWDNPELAKRKCNMSCMACHVNPTGGGMRNSGGRYYGQSTLSMLPLQHRSYSDSGREIFSAATRARFKARFDWDAEPRAEDAPKNRNIPSDFDEVKQGIGQGQRGGWTAYGKPIDGPAEMAFWDGRYGDLNADPAFSFGFDYRSAYWSQSRTIFPMQMDVHASVHPVEHVTAMVTAAGRGRVSGPQGVFAQDAFPMFVRNAFIMAHELPYMTYMKAGVFMPSFGLYIDDHTSFTREYFEMDVSQSDSTVAGVEVGLAPNYPFASLSLFQNMLPVGRPEGADGINPGWGAALNLGWRDLGWSLSAHGMVKQRPLAARGDLYGGGIAYGFNPFYFSNWIPVTLMGELSVGHKEQAATGEPVTFLATYHELWITILNGLSVRAKYDLGQRDLDLSGTVEQRVSGALDISPIPGLTFIAQGRVLFPESDDPGFDVFLQTHIWY